MIYYMPPRDSNYWVKQFLSALDRSLKKSIQTSKSCLLIGQRAALHIWNYFLKNDLKQKETAYLNISVFAQIKYGERETMYENVGGGFTKPLHISNHAYVGPIVPQKKLKSKKNHC